MLCELSKTVGAIRVARGSKRLKPLAAARPRDVSVPDRRKFSQIRVEICRRVDVHCSSTESSATHRLAAA